MILEIIELIIPAIRIWLIISIFICIHWILVIRPHKFEYFVFTSALVGLTWIIGEGIYSLLNFMPNSWGSTDSEGIYRTYRYTIIYGIGAFSSFGIIYLLGILGMHRDDEYNKEIDCQVNELLEIYSTLSQSKKSENIEYYKIELSTLDKKRKLKRHEEQKLDVIKKYLSQVNKV